MYTYLFKVETEIYLRAGKCKDQGQFINIFKCREKLAARGQKQRSCVPKPADFQLN